MSIIFLNGCTSAGKSGIARCLQEGLSEPWLAQGIDDAFAMIPTRLHNLADGFFFDRDDRGLIRLNCGPFGLATLKAHQLAAAATARSGMNLILDEVVFTPGLREGWVDALAGLDVWLIGVQCDLAELERREIERGDRVRGQARGQFDIVHAGMTYDLEVDTTHLSSTEAAKLIIGRVQDGPPPSALSGIS